MYDLTAKDEYSSYLLPVEEDDEDEEEINIENKNKNYTNISQKFLPDSGINLFFLIHNYDYFIHKYINN